MEFWIGGGLKSTDYQFPYSYSWDTESVLDGNSWILVMGFDNAGNNDIDYIYVTVSNGATGDITPPDVSITSPENGDTVSETIKIEVSATDAGGIDRVEFWVDSVLKTTDNKFPYSYSWDTESVDDGETMIVAKAFDDAGNQDFDYVVVTVNNVASCTITYPHDGDTFTEGTGLSIVAVAEDPDGSVEQIEIYEGDNLLGTYSGSSCSHFWSDLRAGSYTLTAKAYDDKGVSATSDPVVITVQYGDTPVTPPDPPAPTPGEKVGFTPGNFAVSDLGSANYTVPFACPPGTANMSPSVALKYDSNSKTGMVGYGWTLSGFPRVMRCGRTVAQDGIRDGVTMNNATDKLSINGQRLINTGGTYFGAGTEYHTEIESFQKVVEENGYFKVYARSGRILYYGSTVDSRLANSAGGGTLTWALSRIEDRFGNYMKYSYTQINGMLLPYRIEYTGNTGQGVTPYAYVQFHFGSQPTARAKYLAGHLMYPTKERLSSVEIYSEGSLVRKYSLTYENGPYVGHSFLKSIQEHDGSGGWLPTTDFTYDFYEDTESHWLQGQDFTSGTGYAATIESFIAVDDEFTPTGYYDLGVRLIDLNGDGLTDFVQRYRDKNNVEHWEAKLNNGTEFISAPEYYPPRAINGVDSDSHSSIDEGVRFVDLNGDGLVDMLKGYWDDLGHGDKLAWLNTGSGWASAASYNPPVEFAKFNSAADEYMDCGVRLVDLNGDGLVDMIKGYLNGTVSEWGAWINTGSGWSVDQSQWHPKDYFIKRRWMTDSHPDDALYFEPGYYSYENGVRMLDVNGDGRLDLLKSLLEEGSNFRYGTWLNTGNGWTGDQPALHLDINIVFSEQNSSTLPTGYDLGVRLVDLNGDGLTDLIRSEDINGTGSIPIRVTYLNTGKGWQSDDDFNAPVPFVARVYSVPAGWDCGVRFTDLNHDGLPDMVQAFLDELTMHYYTYLNTGSGWEPKDSEYLIPNPQRFCSRNADRPGGRPEATRFADLNGDGASDLLYAIKWISGTGESDMGLTHFNATRKPNLIRVENGIGRQITVNYKPLSDPTVYIKGSSAVYPTNDVAGSMHVVSNTSISDGVGGTNPLEYNYLGLRSDLQGRGLLGFEKICITDPHIDSKIWKCFRQDFPYAGKKSWTSFSLWESNVFYTRNDTYYTYEHTESGGVFKTRCSQLRRRASDYSASVLKLLRSTTIDYQHDDYGNATQIKVLIQDKDLKPKFENITDNIYSNDPVNWLLGRNIHSTVTHRIVDQPDLDIVRQTSFEFDPATGVLKKEIIEEGTGNELARTYTYDGFGNRATTTVTGSDIPLRSISVDHDTRGRFPIRSTNELGHVIETEYDQRFGLPEIVTYDPLGHNLVTAKYYDTFGRLMLVYNPDGTYSARTYAWTSSPTHAVYKVTTVAPNVRPPATQYHDCLDRVIRSETIDRFGRTVISDTVIDWRGQVEKKSEPYFPGDTPDWTSYEYDDLSRVISTSLPDGGGITIRYMGLWVIKEDKNLNPRYELYDVRGNLIQVSDAMYFKTTYEYDAAGQLTATEDHLGNRMENTYDYMGRKIATDDPDMGYWEYDYNALGELVGQTDAQNQTTTMEYDKLGRLVERIEPGDAITRWTYDTGFKGSLAGATSSSSGHEQEYLYDLLGRLRKSREKIAGIWYEQENSYDEYGRASELTYPDPGNGLFRVKSVFNANGYANELRDAATDDLFWQVNDTDASGRILDKVLGNGVVTTVDYDPVGRPTLIISNSSGTIVQGLSYSYDPVGNLRYRTDHTNGINESFTYDALYRLKSWTSDGAEVVYDYDAIGNLTNKSDVGSYDYDYLARPHAVISAGGNDYDYDENGNMTHNRTDGNLRQIDYTSFNKPSQLEYMGDTFTFTYGVAHQRIMKEGPDRTMVYMGGLYEKIVEGTATTHRFYIAGGTCILERVATDGLWQENRKYVHKDHLGSTHTVTDQNGNVIEINTYAPFGKKLPLMEGDLTRGFTGHEHDEEFGLINMKARLFDPVLGRFLSPDPLVQSPANPQSLNRYSYCLNNPLSYTDPSGYLSLGDLNPINIIDSATGLVGGLFDIGGSLLGGLFESVWDLGVDIFDWHIDVIEWQIDLVVDVAEEVVDVVEEALENPYIRMGVSIAIMVFAPELAIFTGFEPWAIGAICGGLSSGVMSGGDLKSMAIGAISGGGVAAIGQASSLCHMEKVMAHATLGGVTSELQGGKFADGFIVAGITKGLSKEIHGVFGDAAIAGAVASAVVGGASAELIGADFGDAFGNTMISSAMTAGMSSFRQYLYNEAKYIEKAGPCNRWGNCVVGEYNAGPQPAPKRDTFFKMFFDDWARDYGLNQPDIHGARQFWNAASLYPIRQGSYIPSYIPFAGPIQELSSAPFAPVNEILGPVDNFMEVMEEAYYGE